MKKLFVLTLLVMPSCLFAQQKIEQYCELTAQNKLLSSKVTIDVDFGEERKFFSFKDNRIKDDLGKVKSFNTVIAALNYMGSLGWQFVDAFPVNDSGNGKIYHYYFKREFDVSELEKTTN